jgi:hypothetical protein
MPAMVHVNGSRLPSLAARLRLRESDAWGAPAWLGLQAHPRALWYRVGGSSHDELTYGAVGPRMLPALQRELSAGPRFGRPRLVRSEPELCELAAWLLDVCGWGTADVARRLYPCPHPEELSAASTVWRRADRDARAGRRRLHDRGALPWAVFDEGQVASDWSSSAAFEDGIALWELEELTRPSAPAEPERRAAQPPLRHRLASTLLELGAAGQLHLLGRALRL